VYAYNRENAENLLPRVAKLTLLIKYTSLMVWVLNKVVKC